MLRWQLEVTFQEVRAHLGVETQRQWSDRAIARTTPVLMGLFSWIALARPPVTETTAHGPAHGGVVRQTSTHLHRCHSLGAPTPVAGIGEFFNVATATSTLYKS